MRYLVYARLKPGREAALPQAIEDGTLGAGFVAGNEYLRDITQARLLANGTVCWVEACFCYEPLEEEIPYWAAYFDLEAIKGAHGRDKCRELNGEELGACSDCDCTERLEPAMEGWDIPFWEHLPCAVATIP